MIKICRFILFSIFLLSLAGCKYASTPLEKLKKPLITTCTDESLQIETQSYNDNSYFKINTNNEGATAYWCGYDSEPGPNSTSANKGSGTGTFAVGPLKKFAHTDIGGNDIYTLKVIVVKNGMAPSDIETFDGQLPPP